MPIERIAKSKKTRKLGLKGEKDLHWDAGSNETVMRGWFKVDLKSGGTKGIPSQLPRVSWIF